MKPDVVMCHWERDDLFVRLRVFVIGYASLSGLYNHLSQPIELHPSREMLFMKTENFHPMWYKYCGDHQQGVSIMTKTQTHMVNGHIEIIDDMDQGHVSQG